ncbi:MAG: CoA transferase, partial [Gammaproteobacteria bacterium]
GQHSIYWAELNKGKRSLAIDLKHLEARELVIRLITAPGANGGILSTNLPATGWLAYERLKTRREDVIQLAIVGDRHGGSAVDYTVNAQVGYPYLTGAEDDERPVNHVLPAWDITTAMLAATSLLAALRFRDQTGRGQKIDLALADVALTTVGHLGFIGDRVINGFERTRGGNYLYGAFGRDFVTRDRIRVMVIAISAKMWSNLLAATGLQDAMRSVSAGLNLSFDQEGDRYIGRREIAAVLETWIKGETFDNVARLFNAHGVCWGKYQTLTELIDHDPDCSPANPVFHRVEQPNIGAYPVAGVPATFNAVTREPAKPAPRLGEHTDEILAEVLGLSSGEIGSLHDRGIITGPNGS